MPPGSLRGDGMLYLKWFGVYREARFRTTAKARRLHLCSAAVAVQFFDKA